MACNLIGVKEASSSKLEPTQVCGWVARGWGDEVEDAMERFGWQREHGPGATLMVGVKEGRVEGSQWSVRGSLDPFKVKASHL